MAETVGRPYTTLHCPTPPYTTLTPPSRRPTPPHAALQLTVCASDQQTRPSPRQKLRGSGSCRCARAAASNAAVAASSTCWQGVAGQPLPSATITV